MSGTWHLLLPACKLHTATPQLSLGVLGGIPLFLAQTVPVSANVPVLELPSWTEHQIVQHVRVEGHDEEEANHGDDVEDDDGVAVLNHLGKLRRGTMASKGRPR